MEMGKSFIFSKNIKKRTKYMKISNLTREELLKKILFENKKIKMVKINYN